MIVDIGKNDNGSFHFAGINIKPNETYIHAICRTTPLRQRTLWGLSLKLVSLRLRQEHNKEADVIKEYNRLSNMTDEEYNLEALGNIRQ